MGIYLAVGLFVTSIVGTISVAAGEEEAECQRVSQQMNEATAHYQGVVQSLQKFDQNIEQNYDQVVNYLKTVTDELKKLKNEYVASQQSMRKKYGNIQFMVIIFLAFFIGFLALRYINGTKLK